MAKERGMAHKQQAMQQAWRPCAVLLLLRAFMLEAAAAAFPTRIVVAPAATEVERWAVAKLADLLALPVIDASAEVVAPPAPPQIAVGAALGIDPETLAALGHDAFLASTSQGDDAFLVSASLGALCSDVWQRATVPESRAAALGAAAPVAVAPDPKPSFRVAQARTAVQFVALHRWEELIACASSSKTSWPVAASITSEFDLFAAVRNRSGAGHGVLLNGGGTPMMGLITATNAALAPNGSRNAGGQVEPTFHAQFSRAV